MLMHNSWRLIESSPGTASWNMAVDEALLNGYSANDLPILRLYAWESALSLGRFSSYAKNLDTQRMETQKVPYVRRITGGGILVHGADLSYAMIIPRAALRGQGVKENYHHWCGFLIRLYEKLGLDAQYASRLEIKTNRSDNCLAGTEHYDIIINGQKMGGNAQRYQRHALLQHGTIPMHLESSYFDPLFTGDSGVHRAATLKRLGIAMEYKELASLIKEAFCETFEVTLVCDTLTLAEENCAQELWEQKYTQEGWNVYGHRASS